MELNKQKSQIFNSKPHTVSSTGMFNFAWDNNGNMTQRSTNNTDGNLRNLCWDEENRLMGVTDFYEFNPVKTSAYVYNAGGERVWKFSGDIQQMTINGDQLINMANISNKTLYSSPYLVANDNNYTKHYFIESERVCSKIGGGFSSPIDPVNQAIIEPINSDQLTISGNFTQHVINSISCTNIESPELNVEPRLHGIEDFINIDENENLQYFSVSDHLGSSSFITDAGGEAVQHLQYLPFGESFVSQTSTSWQTRYTFSGKEKDVETGYSYFGARYYDSELSIWLSVDPMAHKLPQWSPYVAFGDNPINNIDPDGRYFIGVNDKKVRFRQRRDGTIKVGRNASADLKTLVSSVNSSGSKTAMNQIMTASKNESKIHVKIVNEKVDNGLLGLHQAHDKDGNALNWNSAKGDFDGTPAYVEGKDGVYKEATITIFQGNIDESGGNGSYYGFDVTTEQETANTFQHESHHNTDSEFIQDLKNKREGKPNEGIDPHQNIHPQEQKVYQEMHDHNKKEK